MPHSSKNIAALILKLRKNSGLTQMEFAELCGVSFRTLQRIESAEISPRLEMLFRVLKRLNLSPTSFFMEIFLAKHETSEFSGNVSIGTKIKLTTWRQCEEPMLIPLFEVEAIKKALNNDFENATNDIGYWEWNLSKSYFYWSEQMFEIYEIEMKPVFDINWVSKIVVEDRQKIQNDIDNLIRHNIPYDNTHRVMGFLE